MTNNKLKSPPPPAPLTYPGVKINHERLVTVVSFNIIRSEKVGFQFMVELRLPHDGELNAHKMMVEDQPVILEFNFSKHTESYRGKWVNHMVKWEINSEPILILFFVGTKIED